MQDEMYEQVNRGGKNFWWQAGMAKISTSLIKKYLTQQSDLKILSAGCGVGLELENLSKFGSTTGVDISDTALDYCRRRGFKNIVKASVVKLPFPDAEFDLVTSMDVLYHQGVEDDLKAIFEMRRVLKNDAWLLLRVPAGKRLMSDYDKAIHGKKRYNKQEIKDKMEKADFKIKKITYINCFLLPVAIIKRKFIKKAESDLKTPPRLINLILKYFLFFEAFLIRYINLPFGLSIFCIAKKE